jgi:tetratricopeptide (TPR) repeat protein
VGRARELESRLPYQPLIEALRQAAAYPQWPARQAALNLPAIWWAELARLAPELAPPNTPIPATGTSADEPRVWEGVHQFVSALADAQPVVLFLDDLHWADTATLGLLGYLVRQSAGAGSQVTFVAAARPAALRSPLALLEQALVREELVVCLALTRLSADEVMALARQLSPNYGYPLGSWLQRGSEGNPYILAELLRYARDEGILLPQGEVNLARLPTAPVIPQTVYRLIQARLEQLSEPARRVLDAAVATGRQFEFEVVARAAALSDLAALDALDEVRAARLIVAESENTFAFDHALVMEVAYREVGELRHKLLHRRVAEALETIHPDRLDELAGLLAQHYVEGGEPAQAARFAWLAGQRAATLAAWREAAEFFQQALEGAEPPHRIAVLTGLGKALLHAGETGRSLEVLQEAVALIRVYDDNQQAAEVVHLTADALLQQARYDDAIRLAQEMAQHNDPLVRFTAEFLWAAALSLEGLDPEGAARHLAAAEAILRDEEGPEDAAWLGQVEFELGNVEARQGRLGRAVDHFRAALAITQGMSTDEMERWHILAYNNLAYHLHLLGDNDQALEIARTGANLARERGFIGLGPYLLSTLGEIALAQDDLATAEAFFSQGLAQAQRLRHPERIAGLTANLGLAAARRGETALAVHRLATALAQAEAVPSHFLAAQIRLWLAPLLPPQEARPHLAAVRSFVTSGNYRGLAAQLEKIEGSKA